MIEFIIIVVLGWVFVLATFAILIGNLEAKLNRALLEFIMVVIIGWAIVLAIYGLYKGVMAL